MLVVAWTLLCLRYSFSGYCRPDDRQRATPGAKHSREQNKSLARDVQRCDVIRLQSDGQPNMELDPLQRLGVVLLVRTRSPHSDQFDEGLAVESGSLRLATCADPCRHTAALPAAY